MHNCAKSLIIFDESWTVKIDPSNQQNSGANGVNFKFGSNWLNWCVLNKYPNNNFKGFKGSIPSPIIVPTTWLCLAFLVALKSIIACFTFELSFSFKIKFKFLPHK